MTHDFDALVDRRATDSTKWHKFPPDVLPMWVADMDFRSPGPVIQALRERVEQGLFGYFSEQPEFYEVVVAWLAKRFGWRVEPEAIVLLPGVISSFNVAALALAERGAGLLVQTPVYPPILRVAGNAGLRRDDAALARRPDGRYDIDLDVFAGAVRDDTRAFLLCNPHNPVGRSWTRGELTALAEVCLRRRLWIIADEIHGDLVYAGHRHTPIASLDPEIEARTITLIAPSKTFNLPGLKCSLAIIPDAALRERFSAARGDLVRVPNVMGYTALVAAYRDGQPWLDDLLPYLETNRDRLVEHVAAELPGVRVFPPEATYLAWLDCREAALARDACAFFLEHARVGLNGGETFGPGGEGFVRLNFACPRARLLEGLARMGEALRARA
jgi:cysteine-S-conjugate beta-lyase